MYRGIRDAHLNIRVPVELCSLVKMRTGEWVEILVPPENWRSISMSDWPGFMVSVQQVCHSGPYANIIEGINRNTTISICKHGRDAEGFCIPIPNTWSTIEPFEIMHAIDRYVHSDVW